MSTEACVVGIGSFSEYIVKYLDYPKHWYDEVKEGDKVIVHFFLCNSKSEVDILCALLGIEPMDFSTHLIDISKVKTLSLERWCMRHNIVDQYDGFIRMVDLGFEFIFDLDT